MATTSIFQDWQVIDMAGAAEHEDLCEAALFYLLERLRLALENPDETARVKLMVVDEAWRYLKDPAILGYLAEAAKTWRKKNAALVVATQSAVDVTGTAGAEALLESMPTKLFLANPDLPEKARRHLPAEPFRNEHHSRLDPQTGALSTAHRRGGHLAPRSRSGQLLALYLVAGRCSEAGGSSQTVWPHRGH